MMQEIELINCVFFKGFHHQVFGLTDTTKDSMVMHHKNKQQCNRKSPRYQCADCSYKTNQQSDFKQHKLVHTEARPCQHRNKAFPTKLWLKRHLLRHMGHKLHQCSICNKRCILAQDLQYHMRVHDEVRDYQCSLCHAKFKHNSNLTAHQLVHICEKPHQCNICDKNYIYSRPTSLRKHI